MTNNGGKLRKGAPDVESERELSVEFFQGLDTEQSRERLLCVIEALRVGNLSKCPERDRHYAVSVLRFVALAQRRSPSTGANSLGVYFLHLYEHISLIDAEKLGFYEELGAFLGALKHPRKKDLRLRQVELWKARALAEHGRKLSDREAAEWICDLKECGATDPESVMQSVRRSRRRLERLKQRLKQS